MIAPRTAFRSVIVIILAAILVACGGGGGGGGSAAGSSGGGGGSGGGGSGSGSGGGSSGQNVPLNPPSAPVLNYKGNANPVQFNDASVSALADDILFGVFLGFQLADESTSLRLPPSGVIDETFSGPQGGTVHVTGRIADDGTGWVQYETSSYTERGTTWTGVQVFKRLQINNGKQDSLTEVLAIDLNARSSGHDVTMNGSIMHRSTISPATSTVTGNILLLDNFTQAEFLAEDIDLFRAQVSYGEEFSGAARIFDDRHGWVDVEFATPWGVRDGENFPEYGELIGRNGTGKRMRIASLWPNHVSLQYSSGAGNEVDRAARLVWKDSFETQTSGVKLSAPEADAGRSGYWPPGTRVRLNGAFSTHLESSFLTFNWALRFRPPGSTASLDSTTAVRPRITLDQPGRYLIELTTSDGTQIDSDFVVLTADDEVIEGLYPGEGQPYLAPDRTAARGKMITIRHYVADLKSFPHNRNIDFEIYEPDGDPPGVSQDGESATFLTEERGIYMVSVFRGAPSLNGNAPKDFQAVAVNATPLFAPAVSFPITDQLNRRIGDIVAGDLNGDGRDDLLISSVISGNLGTEKIDIYLSEGISLSPAVTLAGGEGGRLGVGDLDSDGRPDIATPVQGGVAVFMQQADGSFPASTFLPGACLTGRSNRPLIVTDIDNDGLNDIVVDGTCIYTLEVFPQQAGGAIGAVQAVGRPQGDSSLAAGDLNDDGLNDLVVALDRDTTGNGNIAIYYGDASGTLPAPQFLAFSDGTRYPPGLGVADLNADGRDDLVFAAVQQSTTPEKSLHVYHQTAGGALTESQVLSIDYEMIEMKLHDFDGDGLVDIGADGLTYGMAMHLQKPNNKFAAATRSYPHVEDFIRAPVETIGDLNGDGKMDVAFGGMSAVILLGLY